MYLYAHGVQGIMLPTIVIFISIHLSVKRFLINQNILIYDVYETNIHFPKNLDKNENN